MASLERVGLGTTWAGTLDWVKCELAKDDYVLKCGKSGFFSSCDGMVAVKPCSCGGKVFSPGTSKGGKIGIFCTRCERGFAVWECPKCHEEQEVNGTLHKVKKGWF
jgi:hypothetical protein